MVRNTTHGYLLSIIGPAGCEGDTKDFGCNLGIIKKHLIKITHAKKKDGIWVFTFDTQILSEHGCHLAHASSSVFSWGDLKSGSGGC